MFDWFDNIREFGGLTLIILSLILIFISGIFFGVTYYIMDYTEDAFQNVDCEIQDNVYVGNCQELWDLSVYPFLALREILVWFSFFFIFALVLGMLIVGYQSGKSPIFLGLFIVFVIVLTYFGIELSNIYRTMLEIDLFRQMMVDFTVYNKVMLNFPWFTFFVGLLSVMLGIVNYQRVTVNRPRQGELDY